MNRRLAVIVVTLVALAFVVPAVPAQQKTVI